MLLRRHALGLAVAILMLACARPALAQDNSAAVEALFGEGKKLASEGKYAEACPRFLASYNLEHRIGTLLNLADCYEKNHQLASAWARFVEARTLAQRENQPERAELATQRTVALEAKLSKLSINVPSPPPGLEIKRDGVVMDPGAYGAAIAVDGGKHVITASAPERATWTFEVTVGAEGDSKAVDVPALSTVRAADLRDGPGVDEKPGRWRTIAGLSVAGVGVVVVGIGTYFGIAALGKKSDSNSNGNCGSDGHPNDCTPTGITLRDDARSDGTVSSVLIGVGAAAVIGGGILWLTAPSSHGAASVGFDGRVFRLRGTF